MVLKKLPGAKLLNQRLPCYEGSVAKKTCNKAPVFLFVDWSQDSCV